MENENLINKEYDNCSNTNTQNFVINDKKSSQHDDEFASSLPQWDLLPPTAVIKRVRRVL